MRMDRQEAKNRLEWEIQASQEHYKTVIEVLGAVKRVYKKSGGDYENITKNLTLDEDLAEKHEITMKWDKSIWSDRGFDNVLIEYKEPNGTRNSLYFRVYECLDERDALYEEMKNNGRLIEGGVGLKDFYEFTPDEILAGFVEEQERTKSRLETLTRRADEIIEQGLAMYDHFKAIEEIKNILTSVENSFDSTAYIPTRRALEPLFGDFRY